MEDNSVKKLDEIQNPTVVKCLQALAESGTPENLNRLCQELVNAIVIVPTDLDVVNDKEYIFPSVLTSDDNRFYQPVYTDVDHLKKGPRAERVSTTEFVKMLSLVIHQNETLTKQGKEADCVAGIVINPATENITLTTDILESVYRSIKKPTKLNLEQYKIVERCNFEQNTLPNLLHGEKELFFKALVNGKEEYLDRLYKMSYQNKDVYSYSAAEFKVDYTTTEDNIDIARIDMPGARDIVGTTPFVYVVWNADKQQERYFAFVNEAPLNGQQTKAIVEVTAEKKAYKVGLLTREGNEREAILQALREE